MDQQKTGQLIAQRRKELNMTQKMLAEKVGVSDRAISKWERGAGFPDVSLIEPLADALQLSLLELFQGERQSPSPAEESSARKVLHFALPQIQKKTRAYKRLLLTLCAILVLLIILFAIPTAGNHQSEGNAIISVKTAVSIAPEILITQDDYDLIDAILSDPVLGAHYDPYPLWKNISRYTLENEDARAFTDYFDNLGLELQYAGIEIHGSNLTITYATSHTSVYLAYRLDGVRKQVVTSEYPIWDENGELIPIGQRHGNRIDLLNENNKTFYRNSYTTGWLEHFSTTYY